VWIILFRFLLLPLLLLLYLPLFPSFSFFFVSSVSIRVVLFFFSPTTLGYARKIGNPGPHYSTVSVFISSPFSRVRLTSDPSCSGLRLRRFRLGPIVCLLR